MKNLVRCNAYVQKRAKKDNSDIWANCGIIEFEMVLSIGEFSILDEDVLNDIFSNLITQQNTKDYKYTYIDYEVVYYFPKRIKVDFNKELSIYLTKQSKNQYDEQ